jgi:bifunctional non-homologous end joining protein LigD
VTDRLPILEPMLPQRATAPFDDSGWRFEPKLDGMRLLAYLEPGRPIRLLSRRGLSHTDEFPWLAQALGNLRCQQAIVDGEVVALDPGTGRPSFPHLQNRRDGRGVLEFYAFDVLWLDGHSLCSRPLADRLDALTRILPAEDARLKPIVGAEGTGQAFYATCLQLGFEGAVAKRLSSRYQPGKRSGDWLKLKPTQRDEFVVGGYTPGTGHRASTFGALILGYYPPASDRLRWVGNVGSGFDDQTLQALLPRLRTLHGPNSFDPSLPPSAGPRSPGPITFLRPELVVEVAYQERTGPDGQLRFPVFLGLRPDVEPRHAGFDAAK